MSIISGFGENVQLNRGFLNASWPLSFSFTRFVNQFLVTDFKKSFIFKELRTHWSCLVEHISAQFYRKRGLVTWFVSMDTNCHYYFYSPLMKDHPPVDKVNSGCTAAVFLSPKYLRASWSWKPRAVAWKAVVPVTREDLLRHLDCDVTLLASPVQIQQVGPEARGRLRGRVWRHEESHLTRVDEHYVCKWRSVLRLKLQCLWLGHIQQCVFINKVETLS